MINRFDRGAAIGVGGDNMRMAGIDELGMPTNLDIVGTPRSVRGFYTTAAEFFIDQADDGAQWGAMGIPGPALLVADASGAVREQIRVTNVPALNHEMDPVAEMSDAKPEFADLVRSGFTYRTFNDGDWAAFAAAKWYADGRVDPVLVPDSVRWYEPGVDYDEFSGGFDNVGVVISGAGVGASIVRRDRQFPSLFHRDPALWESGHQPTTMEDSNESIEDVASGTAVGRITEQDPKDVDEDNPVWEKVGLAIATVAITLGREGGSQLVVLTGSNNMYGYHHQTVWERLAAHRASTNKMSDKTPKVLIVPGDPRSNAHEFELHGAQPAMIDALYTEDMARYAAHRYANAATEGIGPVISHARLQAQAIGAFSVLQSPENIFARL